MSGPKRWWHVKIDAVCYYTLAVILAAKRKHIASLILGLQPVKLLFIKSNSRFSYRFIWMELFQRNDSNGMINDKKYDIFPTILATFSTEKMRNFFLFLLSLKMRAQTNRRRWMSMSMQQLKIVNSGKERYLKMSSQSSAMKYVPKWIITWQRRVVDDFKFIAI